jgi:hypothetical protein
MKASSSDDVLGIAEDEVLFAGVSMLTQPLLMGKYLRVHAKLVRGSKAKNKAIYLGDGLLRYNMMIDKILDCVYRSDIESLSHWIGIINTVDQFSVASIEEGDIWLKSNQNEYDRDGVIILRHSSHMFSDEFKAKFSTTVAMYCDPHNVQFKNFVNQTAIRFLNAKIFTPGDSRLMLPELSVRIDVSDLLGSCLSVFIEDFSGNSLSCLKLPIKGRCLKNTIFMNLLKLCFGYVLEELTGFQISIISLYSDMVIKFIYPGNLDVVEAYFSLLKKNYSNITVVATNIKRIIKNKKLLLSENSDSGTIKSVLNISHEEKLKRLILQNKKLKYDLFNERKEKSFLQETIRDLRCELARVGSSGCDFDSEVLSNETDSSLEIQSTSDIEKDSTSDLVLSENRGCHQFDRSPVDIAVAEPTLLLQKKANAVDFPIRAQFFSDRQQPNESHKKRFQICLSGLNMKGGCKLMSLLFGGPYGNPGVCVIGSDFFITNLKDQTELVVWYTTEQNRALNHIYTPMRLSKNIFHFDLSCHWAAENSLSICEERMIKCRRDALPCFMVGILSATSVSLSAFKLFEETRLNFEIDDVLYCGIEDRQVSHLQHIINNLSDYYEEVEEKNNGTCEYIKKRYNLDDSLVLFGTAEEDSNYRCNLEETQLDQFLLEIKTKTKIGFNPEEPSVLKYWQRKQ